MPYAVRRPTLLALLTTTVLLVALAPMLNSAARAGTCLSRTLVVSAYPSEADAILTHVVLDKARQTIVLKGHHFYLGSIEGRRVVTTMTGIGLVNAMQTTKTALEGFSCKANASVINAVIFSGVAGGAGRTQVADVAAPARWTVNDGKSWTPVDSRLLAIARTIKPAFTSVNTAGDPLCTCQDPDLVPLIDLKRAPKLYVGGDGASADTNSHGEAQLCQPGGGDVFGCEPCHAPDRQVDPVASATTFPAFFSNLIRGNASGTKSSRTYDAVDQETSAVQQIAKQKRVPFLAFRGMSDGPGDPLNLPGFPFQFFFYKQIAAENAAIATAAFFKAWR